MIYIIYVDIESKAAGRTQVKLSIVFCAQLEINRTRMRAELTALVDDHKAYTTDMDDWADDVRVKAAFCLLKALFHCV